MRTRLVGFGWRELCNAVLGFMLIIAGGDIVCGLLDCDARKVRQNMNVVYLLPQPDPLSYFESVRVIRCRPLA
jgi:hypothetical protein